MAVCPETRVNYLEEIDTIILRNTDGITIPKRIREKAFEISIDLIVRSIPRESYKNYTVSPSEGFYGNATLVFQDCVSKKINVEFPRQRIYQGKVDEAFAMWENLIKLDWHRGYFSAIGESIASLGSALGVAVSPEISCCSGLDIVWRELPIREVYFNCPFGTQYEFEVSYVYPIPYEDSCGNMLDPKSKFVDTDKDGGLPSNGIMPNIADDPNNPFARLPPSTTNSAQGDYSNSKAETFSLNPSPLENVDPNNSPLPPDPEGTLYWVKTEIRTNRPEYVGGCQGLTRVGRFHYQVSGADVSVVSLAVASPATLVICGKTIASDGWNLQLTGGEPFPIGFSDDTPIISFGRGMSLPSSQYTFE